MTPPKRFAVTATALNLLLSLASLAVFLLLAEGAARWIEPRPEIGLEREPLGDWRQWQDGFLWFGSRPPSWPPGEEPNRDGMRDAHHAYERSEGVDRIVILGDSVTYGWGVKPAAAYPRQLAARLEESGARVEILNVAMPGWTTRQERMAYERIIRKYRPDEVWLGICLNDPVELQVNLTRPSRALLNLHRHSALVRLLVDAPGREIRQVEDLFRQPEAAVSRAALQRFFDEVSELHKTVAADGVRLSVLLFPYRFQLARDAPPPVLQARIRAFWEARGIPILDLLPALAALGETAFIDHNHLAPAGAAAVAAAIQESPLLAGRHTYLEALERRGLGSVAAGPASANALSALARLLRNPDWQARAAAAWALGRSRNRETLPTSTTDALARATTDPHELVRSESLRSLGRATAGGGIVGALVLASLEDPREQVRLEAARTLWAWPADAHQVPGLVAALDNGDPMVRAVAQSALARLGPATVEALTHALSDPAPETRRRAARVLGRIGPAASGAAPALLICLGDPDERVRANAARALGRLGPSAAAVLPALRRARAQAPPSLAGQIAEAIASIEAR